MALTRDAVMVLFCDVSGDAAGHDDWHTYEHMHERLSIPGFVRGTRWTRAGGSPRYMIVYEVAGTEMANSRDYLERLDHPSEWTTATMKRLRGMVRGFCDVVASAGYGLGRAAIALRFAPGQGFSVEAIETTVRALAARRGVASVMVLAPARTAPMTTEQSIRGRDGEMSWMLLATGYDPDALRRAWDAHAEEKSLARLGIAPFALGTYDLAFTATADEVARTAPNPVLDESGRDARAEA